MKKILSAFLALLIFASALSACRKQDAASPSPIPSASLAPLATEEPTAAIEPTAATEPTAAPYEFEIDYHKCPKIFEDALGGEMLSLARLAVDAFLAGQSSVVLPNLENAGGISMLLLTASIMCPPFGAYVDATEVKGYDAQTETLSWNFYDGDGTLKEIVGRFEECIRQYMSVLVADDTELMRAIFLYHAYTENMEYDYDAYYMTEIDGTDPVMRVRLSGYNALVNKLGMCSGISEGLCFLFNQADIDCCTVNCFEGESGAHEWLIAKFDDKYYFCDPTWEAEGGFKYFGLSFEDRASWAGGYLEQNILAFNTPIAEKYRVDDTERFSALRWVEEAPDEIVREGTSIIIRLNSYSEPIVIDCK